MRLYLLLIFLLNCSISFCQMFSISGKVFDEKNNPIANASVICRHNGIFGAATNNDGTYYFQFPKADSIEVEFSHYDFKPYKVLLKASESTKLDVILKENRIVMDEVTVKGELVRVSDKAFVYIPLQKQKERSYSGTSLLYNLMLPDINVNPFTDIISSNDGSMVSLYIDNRKASLQEIKDIRPKDIIKVEIYNNDINKFPNEQKVINFVCKKYSFGGFVDLKSDNRILYQSYDQRVHSGIDLKKWNFSLVLDANASKDKDESAKTIESFLLSDPFIKTSETSGKKNNQNSYYGILRTTYKGDNLMFYSQISYEQSHQAQNSQTKVIYDRIYENSTAYQNTKDRRQSPNIMFFLSKRFNNKHILESNFSYTFLRRKFDRLYYETSIQPLKSNIKENAHNFDSKIKWSFPCSSNSNLSFLLWGTYSQNNDIYGGSSNSKQKLINCDLLLYPTYSISSTDKWYLSLQAGFDVSHAKINNEISYSKIYPRPAITFNYFFSKKSSIYFDARMGSTIPLLSMMNSANIRLNSFQIIKGNPDLKPMKIADVLLSHNIHTGNFRLSTFCAYNALYDLSKTYYFNESSNIIQTYITNGNYHSINMGIGASMHALKHRLQLKANISYLKQFLTGLFSNNNESITYSISALYQLNRFTFSLFYNSKQNRLLNMPSFIKSPHDYGTLISWTNKNLLIEVGARRFFDKRNTYRQSFDYKIYNTDSYKNSDSLNEQLYIKLNYSFDFGRKINKNNIEKADPAKSAILL